MKITFSKIDIADLQREIQDWYLIELSQGKVRELLRYYPQVAAEMFLDGVDTVTRETMADAIADDVLAGHSWPIGMDPKMRSAKFFKEFAAAAPERGYRLPKDWLRSYL